MRRADQKDRVLSTSEDSLSCIQSSKACSPPPPLTRSRPLSDIYPFQSPAERSPTAPSRLSGCSAQVQPLISGPKSESRLNGINSSAWSGPPDGKPYSSRIMRLFSNPRKCPGPGHSQTTDGPSATQGPHGVNGSQAWTGLPGLGVIDSFKRLRSSVLQGIQSRGTANQDGEFPLAPNHETTNGLDVTRQGHGPDVANQFKCEVGYSVSNGMSVAQEVALMSQYDSECEDEDDEEDGDGDSLTRNTRFSRSIRRAYGAGRISLQDAAQRRRAGVGGTDPSTDLRETSPGSESDITFQTERSDVNTNVKGLSRRSKSTENLNLFKTPFRREAPSDGPPSPQPDSPDRPVGIPCIQRTASASSVDLRGRSVHRWKSPMRTKDHMLKLVGSMSDLTTRRRPSPSPVPPSTPRSRLHDDYTRRLPCLPAAERQRRPSPTRTRAAGAGTQVPPGHAPKVHALPHSDAGPVQHQVLISPVRTEPAEQAGDSSCASVDAEPPAATSTRGRTTDLGLDSPPLHHRELLHLQEQTSQPEECVSRRPDSDQENQEAPSDQQVQQFLLQQEEASPASSHSPSPADLSSEPPASPSEETSTSPETTTPRVQQRRRAGRARPRPISDYGQLVSRKYPIPEEEAEPSPGDCSPYGAQRQHSSSSSSVRCEGACSPESCGVHVDVLGRKQRPISVIGVVELPSSPGAEDREVRLPSPHTRPPLPPHDIPPYRAVSARFRPSTLSQSTPIGLDRLGKRKLLRGLSDDVSQCPAVLDDGVSEEEGSFDEISDATPYLQPGVELSLLNEWISSGHAVCAEALWDHVTMEEEELAFKAGDVIRVLDASHEDWWWGRGPDRDAWFPSSFVRVRVNQEDSSTESVADQEHPAPCDTHSVQHREQMRSNVVQEIMNTERIYIKHLRDICEGYIRQCRKHPTMFTELQLKTIFSNIEDIYRFQRQFLRDLERNHNKEQPHLSEIGSCFLLQGEGFSIYSEYCNTHPSACAELHRLMKLGRYKHFFEACRLLQQMIDISIAGFLLTPVQKICKYPLQLGELLKYTPKDHSDYSGVNEAYEAMKNVASLINERKRRLESIDAIAQWQVAILRWEGADVLECSSELIHSGEMTRIIRQGKTQQRSFFLFDHQLVFCKKDVLRRDLLHYRGRLDMDQTEVQELPDGRDLELGLTLRNALRLRHAYNLEVLCILCCRKAQDKQRWLEAFARERRRVQEDQEMGMEISEEQRKHAIFNARKIKHGKIKSIGYSGSISPHHQSPHQNLHPLHQRHVTVPTSVPQQQVFSLAEPPKRKPAHLWYSITRSAFFRK